MGRQVRERKVDKGEYVINTSYEDLMKQVSNYFATEEFNAIDVRELFGVENYHYNSPPVAKLATMLSYMAKRQKLKIMRRERRKYVYSFSKIGDKRFVNPFVPIKKVKPVTRTVLKNIPEEEKMEEKQTDELDVFTMINEIVNSMLSDYTKKYLITKLLE